MGSQLTAELVNTPEAVLELDEVMDTSYIERTLSHDTKTSERLNLNDRHFTTNYTSENREMCLVCAETFPTSLT